MAPEYTGVGRKPRAEGYRGLANLAVAIENDLIRRRNAAIKELTTTLTV